jgi:hypothetical protein
MRKEKLFFKKKTMHFLGFFFILGSWNVFHTHGSQNDDNQNDFNPPKPTLTKKTQIRDHKECEEYSNLSDSPLLQNEASSLLKKRPRDSESQDLFEKESPPQKRIRYDIEQNEKSTEEEKKDPAPDVKDDGPQEKNQDETTLPSMIQDTIEPKENPKDFHEKIQLTIPSPEIQLIKNFLGTVKPETDVHQYTRPLGAHYPTVRTLVYPYLDPTLIDPSTVDIKQIEKEMNPDQSNQSITKIFNNIRSFWNHPIDHETKQNLQDVLLITYCAATLLGEDYIALFKQQLCDNIETNGGCHPGITGRLIFLLSNMALELINQR